MRYWIAFMALALLALPLSVSAQSIEGAGTHAVLALHASSHAPPQLMLRASYFYDVGVEPSGAPPLVGFALLWVISPLSVGAQTVEEDSLSSWQSEEPTTVTEEGQPTKRLSRRARIAIGVTVPIVILGSAAGITTAVVSNNYQY